MTFTTRHAVSSACVAALLTLVTYPVHAQQTAPAPASTPAANAVAVPTMPCEKPPPTPGIEPSAAQLRRFQKQIDSYRICVNEYARAMAAKSNEHADQARAYAAAANGAIADYNSYVNELNARTKGESGSK